jgi:hypothetical protein
MKPRLKSLLLLVPVLFIAACGGGNDTEDRLDVADPKVRFVDANPTSPQLTLYKTDSPQSDATNVGYKYASKYFDIGTDNATWSLRTTGTPATTIASVPLNPQRGTRYILLGLPGTPIGDLALVRDPYNKGLTSDKARVRGVNAAVNAQAVDMYLTVPGASLANATPTLGAVGFKQAVPGDTKDSVEVDGATYQLRMTSAGTKNVIFNASVTFQRNSDWLLIAVPDTAAPNSVKLLLANGDDDNRTMQEVVNTPTPQP